MTRQTRQTLKKRGIRKFLAPFTLGLAFVGFVAFTIAG
jgi:hypothetical protein